MRAKVVITCPNPYQTAEKVAPKRGAKDLVEEVPFDEITEIIGPQTVIVSDVTDATVPTVITRTVCIELDPAFVDGIQDDDQKIATIEGVYRKVALGAISNPEIAVTLGAAVC